MRYKVWDGVETIYTLGRDEQGRNVFSPEDWKETYPFLNAPGAKCIIGGGAVNGALCEEYRSYIQRHIEMGCPVDLATMTDEEIMLGMELWEDGILNAQPTDPSLEERAVAAAEFANLLAMENAE
jgi:hypothetical protein